MKNKRILSLERIFARYIFFSWGIKERKIESWLNLELAPKFLSIFITSPKKVFFTNVNKDISIIKNLLKLSNSITQKYT